MRTDVQSSALSKSKRMDFLFMAFIYTLIFVTLSYLVFFGSTDFHRTGLVGFLRRKLFSVAHLTKSTFEKCVPAALTGIIRSATTYLLFKRNPCIQLLYGFLMSGGTAIYSFKVIPYFDKMNTFSIVTYILIAINVVLFWVCCTHDPGVIKVTNHTEYMNDYNPDGVYYTTQECSTCKFIKPARSKHCSLCDVCVSRFDHHCSWVNNCIGKKNYKFFLCFIISTAILCVYGTLVMAVVFGYIVLSKGLITMNYEASDGKRYPVGIRFLTQYLLVRQPLLAILFLVVLFFGVAMTGFFLFHFYLVLTNQTTNEFYKRHYYGKSHPKLSRQSKIVSSQTEKTMIRTTRRRTLTRNKETSSRTSTNDVVATEKLPSPRTSTPYYIGIWRNITEVMRV
ncbi:unnamed protein product [Pocillopora meandrina]|uniref:Palmitoyltransferase n=1 Tax=Pocillopora meandrina TaxID=46732 RepID=A0AAU9VUG8_9CNID|nr:unnamed protein product [Pocillopora meandrina]